MVTEAILRAVCFLIYFSQSHLAAFSTPHPGPQNRRICSFRGKSHLSPSQNLNQYREPLPAFSCIVFFPNSNIAHPRPRYNTLSISAVPKRQPHQVFPTPALVPHSLGSNCSTCPTACGEAPAPTATRGIRVSQALAAASHPPGGDVLPELQSTGQDHSHGTNATSYLPFAFRKTSLTFSRTKRNSTLASPRQKICFIDTKR